MITDLNKIVKEWSYRVDDGKPNPNNSTHLYHLSEILIEYKWPFEVIDEFLQNINEVDIVQKKQDLLEDIARQPANVVFARIAICDEIQLADLMKIEFIPYFRGTAKSVSGSSSGDTADSLHRVCVNLAKQRALLQGSAINEVMQFNIQDTSGTSAHSSSGDLSFPKLQDAS